MSRVERGAVRKLNQHLISGVNNCIMMTDSWRRRPLHGPDRCDRCDRWFIINCTSVCCLTNAEGFCFYCQAGKKPGVIQEGRRGEERETPCPCQGPNYLQQEAGGPLIFLFPESMCCDSSPFPLLMPVYFWGAGFKLSSGQFRPFPPSYSPIQTSPWYKYTQSINVDTAQIRYKSNKQSAFFCKVSPYLYLFNFSLLYSLLFSSLGLFGLICKMQHRFYVQHRHSQRLI